MRAPGVPERSPPANAGDASAEVAPPAGAPYVRRVARSAMRALSPGASEARLVERDLQLAALAGVAERAVRGSGGLLIVEGRAGVGKTRLIHALREAAGDLRVLAAQADELEREFPFGVVRQLLEPALMAATAAQRRRLLAGPASV